MIIFIPNARVDKRTSAFQDGYDFGNKAMDEVTNEDDGDSSDDHQHHQENAFCKISGYKKHKSSVSSLLAK